MIETRWWWVRHAPVISDWRGTCYGNMDVPADTSDPEPFRFLARVIPEAPVLVTTGLSRTEDTAAGIARAGIVLPAPRQVETFQEQCFGEWQGRTNEELMDVRSGEMHRFWRTPAREVPPGGESFEAVCHRVAETVARIGEELSGRDILVVAHGGSIRAALALALGLTPEAALQFQIDNLSLTRLDHIVDERQGGAWRVATVNRLA